MLFVHKVGLCYSDLGSRVLLKFRTRKTIGLESKKTNVVDLVHLELIFQDSSTFDQFSRCLNASAYNRSYQTCEKSRQNFTFGLLLS